MSSIIRLFSRIGNFVRPNPLARKSPAKGSSYRRSSTMQTALAFWLLSSFWLSVISVGAAVNPSLFNSGSQTFNPLDLKSDSNSTEAKSSQKDKKSLNTNIDIRVNGGRGDLVKAIGQQNLVKSAGKENSLVGGSALSQLSAIREGINLLQAKTPGADVKLSEVTGAVEVVRSSGTLTEASKGRGEDIVRGFIRNNKALYGLSDKEISNLKFLGESISKDSGMRMVRMVQHVNGRSVFQSETRFIIDREGRLVRSTGLIIPRASVSALPLENLISPQEALRATMEHVGINLDVAQMSVAAKDAKSLKADSFKTELTVNDSRITDKVTSQIVYFPIAPGVLVPAWSQIIFSEDADWYALADARDGTLLWRKNIRHSISTHQARFRVYVQADGSTPADNPAPLSPTTVTTGTGFQPPGIAPTIVNMLTAQNILASPNGWIDDCPGGVCTAAQTQTIGNNVHAYMDRITTGGDANIPDTAVSSVLDGNGKPTGNPDANSRNRDFLGTTPRDFQTNFLPPPQGGNPEAGQTATGAGASGTLPVDQFRRGAVTQLFYTSNWYHDKLFALGFDEAAGNYQQTNFGGMGGVGGDRVLAEVQDGSDTDNANFSVTPDGTPGRMQMFRFIGPTIDRDSSLDAEIVIHELTHGTSNRLIGNADGLIWSPGQGMGEGWGDFYALSLLNNTNADDPNGNYASGAYATYKLGGLLDNYLYGIRRFPYSTNNSVNPLTWADVDDTTNNLSGGIPPSPLDFNFGGGFEVHNSGELWALSLWEVRSRIIADPLGANGNVPTGNQTMLQLVTDAMKMTPINPSFTDGRDALIDADCAYNACANEHSIWAGFADRGLGYKAVAPLGINGFGNIGHMGIGESFAAPNLDAVSYTIDDSFGNNNGFVDPNEPIKLTVALKNPWRQSTKSVALATGTLTTSTAGVTIVDNSSTYGPIAANTTANPAAGDTFVFRAPAAATCGQSLKFTVATASTLGAGSSEITVRVGQPSGTGAPVIFTDSAVGLAIPDDTPRGVTDTFTISQDLQIADINFRVDNLQHTFTGDLTVMLRAPNGYGSELIWLREALFAGGDGDNFINTVIDDEATNDLNQTFDTDAPFTDSYKPAFNSPVWLLFGDPAIFPDPVGHLSRMDGLSTQGDWKVHVADFAGFDTGTLNAWSIIVTPVNFVCTAPVVTVGPTVTINQAMGQADPTSTSPINFTVVFSQPVTNFATGDVTLSGTAGATTAVVTGSGTTYNVAVSGMTQSGTVVATINAGVATNEVGDPNQASTSIDNTVTYVLGSPPTIVAQNSTRSRNTSANIVIATVNDADQTENTLVVTATPVTGTGVTITGISVSPTGVVTANVAVSPTATTSTFTLQVTDNSSQSATATLTITVVAGGGRPVSPSNP